MSTFTTPLPPPPPPSLAFISGGSDTPVNQIPPYMSTPSPSPSSSSSIVIVIIIVASAIIVSASIYLLLRLISKRFHRSFRTFAAADDVVVLRHDSNPNLNQCRVVSSNLLDSLPFFTFGSITGNLTGGDCAVCLSKFEPQDQLILLPLCCHAFHAGCIDSWLVSNQTCPLCRSSVLPSDSEVLDKIMLVETGGGGNIIENNFENRNGSENGGSFRIEMGSISRRRGTEDTVGAGQRSYSIGSFEYIVDNGYEVSVGSTTHRRGSSDCNSLDKESSIGVPVAEPLPGEVLAGEVSRGRNWLREYVDRLASISVSSRSMSFRSSGRFFTGSSRRSDTIVPVEDLEANHVGEEISELFRWLSGV